MQLLQHFKELTIRPKNAEELKGLILQLAIQGKLTANWRKENPDIESANILIKNILQDKERLIKLKKSKQKKHLSNVSEEEKPFNLPKSWVWCRLGDITDLPYGKGLSKKDLTVEGYYVFGANGIIGKYSSYLYEDEQLLISCRGAYSGKTNISPKKCFVTSNSLVCEFFNKDLTFYKYFFYSITALPKEKIVSGSAQPQVTATNALPLPIALPPLEEQKEIVKVVETFFKEVEQLEQLTEKRIGLKEDFVTSALQQLTTNNVNQEWSFLQDHFKSFFNEKTNIKKLRETVLQLAVQGKLTSDWRANNPNTEDASQLLKRIQAERSKLISEKRLKKTREKGDILEGEFNLDLPSSWTIAKTVDLGFITKLAGFEYSKHINLQDEGEVPVIRAQNVKPNRIDETKLKYIDLETSKLLSRCELVKESLLITFIGAGIGEVAVFRKKKRWHLAPNVAKLEPFNEFNHNIEIDYLLFYLLSPIGRRELFKHMKSTAQPSLSMGTIRDIIVCLPPIEEQKAIVEKVNALMGLCDGLAQEVQQSQEHSELLMQSVLRAIFEEK